MSGLAAADLDATLKSLRERRDRVRDQYRIEILGVFGSVARGEATSKSDVDVLADFLDGATLFKLSRARRELEAALGQRVDLVDRGGLRPFARPSVERDLIRL